MFLHSRQMKFHINPRPESKLRMNSWQTYEIPSENTHRAADLPLQPFTSPALPASEIPKPATLCGKSASPRIFPRASHLQKGFPQGRGQAESTVVYSPSIMADPARWFSHLAASTLPPTESLWLEVGEGCLNLFYVVKHSSEHQLPSPPLGLLLFLTPGKDPNAFSFPKLYSKLHAFAQIGLLRRPHSCPAQDVQLVRFQVIRYDFFGGGVAVSLSLI